MSASDLSAAVGMRNRLFLLYPKWPGPEPGLLQRSSGAQVRWVPCGARTPANFETSRISCVVVLSIMGLLYRPSNVVSKVGSHVELFFFFFFWALQVPLGVLLHRSRPLSSSGKSLVGSPWISHGFPGPFTSAVKKSRLYLCCL